MRSVFIGAHYDDVILSCGALQSVVDYPVTVTVFGGVPKASEVLTAYDQKSGFESAIEAVESRKVENDEANLITGARVINLNHVEEQYSEDQDREAIEKDLQALLDSPEYDEYYFPIGIKHPDHILLGDICKDLNFNNKKVCFYADVPYYVDFPELYVARLNLLGVTYKLNKVWRGGDNGARAQALLRYMSQIKTMNLNHLLVDEIYYEIV